MNELMKTVNQSNIDMDNHAYTSLLEDMIAQRNAETREHMWYVKQYAGVISKRYAKIFPRSRMTKRKQELIIEAAGVHDVGKLMMQDCLLYKQGKMSVYEFDMYKKHTIKGGQIIKSLSSGRDRDFERICYNVCVYHHEKYDGSGYPYGLKEDKIPVEAQIVALADIYDTLLRCKGRESFSKDMAYNMIMNGDCGKISPKIADCFKDLKDDLEEIDYAHR